jgi:RNA polymerase subunit RPABC4/transcription elongation factor Spt4
MFCSERVKPPDLGISCAHPFVQPTPSLCPLSNERPRCHQVGQVAEVEIVAEIEFVQSRGHNKNGVMVRLTLKKHRVSSLNECPSCRTVHEGQPKFCKNCGCRFGSDPECAVGVDNPAYPLRAGRATARCGDCHVVVPMSSKFCPNCGAAFDRRVERYTDNKAQSEKLSAWLSAVLLVGLALFCFFGFPDASASRDKGGSSYAAHVMAEKFVTRELRSPASARFSGITDPETVISDLGAGRFRVSGYVDSQNGFGALLRSNYTCTVKYGGHDTWSPEAVSVLPR